MARYEDYVKDVGNVTEVSEEIDDAARQQEVRKDTPAPDWEKRYNDLEVAFSRQGQQMGDYRKMIDDYVTTTPDESQSSVEISPITPDDIYENPDEAVRRAVDSHPAIQKVQDLEKELEHQRTASAIADFGVRHPGYQETYRTSEFANWVNENPMRSELLRRADGLDMTAADALFELWELEATKTTTQQANDVDTLGLETGHGADSPAPDRYSRSAMLEQKIRAKQGDLKAEQYVKTHAVPYREALGAGNVRD